MSAPVGRVHFVDLDEAGRAEITERTRDREVEVREHLEQTLNVRRARWFNHQPSELVAEIACMEAALCCVPTSEVRASVRDRYADATKTELVHAVLDLELEVRATCAGRWRGFEVHTALAARTPDGGRMFTVNEFLDLPSAARKIWVARLLRSVTPEQVQAEVQRAAATPWW